MSKTTQETIIPCTVEQDLDQLIQEKTDLIKNIQYLEEQQTKLDLQARSLLERITQEIKKRNDEKKQTINQLREQNARMEDMVGLEDKIEETQKTNSEKQEGINHLKEEINALELEFQELAQTTETTVEVLNNPTDRHEIHAPEFSKREENATPLDVFPI